MEYKRIFDNWREAGKTGDIGRAVELLEKQITKNLLDVRNAFAVDVADDPDAAFGFLFDIGDIKPEYRDMMGEFCDLGEELEYISMDRGMADCRHPDEDYLGRYVLLEEKVISAMEKFDGDYILRELCRTLKGQLRELRNTFCCLCCAYEKKSVSVNRVFENYIRCIEAGGDPVAIVETVQAKLKAVRDRTAMEETTEYAETDASRRELLSVVVTMEGVFRANGCDMDLLETSLSRCALYHGSCRHLDDKAIEPVRELSEKDTVTQLLSLAQRALQYSDRLGQAIDGIGKKRSAKVDYKFAMERSIGYV